MDSGKQWSTLGYKDGPDTWEKPVLGEKATAPTSCGAVCSLEKAAWKNGLELRKTFS